MITYTPANALPCSRNVREKWDGSEDVVTERRATEIAMLQQLFGPRWSDLKPEHLAIADLLMREIAPQRDARTPGLRAGLRLLLGRVPRSPDRMRRNPCDPSEPVVFWANHGHGVGGLGYRLFGGERGGWLVRCGYAKRSDTASALREKVPKFPEDFGDVAEVLGLVITGCGDRRRFSLRDMRLLAGCDYGLDRLGGGLRIRVRASEACLFQWWRFFTDCEDLSPAGSDDARYRAWADVGVKDLLDRLAKLGVTQRQLAIVLGISRSYLTELSQIF